MFTIIEDLSQFSKYLPTVCFQGVERMEIKHDQNTSWNVMAVRVLRVFKDKSHLVQTSQRRLKNNIKVLLTNE